ncbi:MAG TPA: CocE/NonD family hydrolase C-terminal non-catalytic domain-containing protein, partial [Solirubrobacterales bacterium]
RFFDHFLKGEDNGFDAEPPVRLEVREDGATVREVRGEASWPPAGVRWTELFLDGEGTLGADAPGSPGVIAFATRSGRPSWSWTVPRDLELSGPMALRLRVELAGADWANLFAGVEKWRDGRQVGFEGSYGFGRDRVATGWLKVRGTGPTEVEIELGPSATWFRAGEELRLVLAGRWLSPRNPLTGQFPAAYEPSRAATCRVHCGGEQPARLLVPALG